MMRTQVGIEQRMFWRNHSSVFFTFVMPLLLLVFSGLFSGSHDDIVPGIAALAVVSVSFQALAISLAFHRDQGVLKRFIASPLPVNVFVAGKIVSTFVVVAIELTLIMLAGMLWLDVPAPHNPALLAASALFGGAAFIALAFGIVSIIRNGDAAPAATNAVYLPMMLISGVFYPVGDLPRVAELLAKALPLYHLVAPMRAAWLGTSTHWAVHLAVLAAWGIVGAVWIARRFHWEPASDR
jgi:ABC-2 type transport system permease protein